MATDNRLARMRYLSPHPRLFATEPSAIATKGRPSSDPAMRDETSCSSTRSRPCQAELLGFRGERNASGRRTPRPVARERTDQPADEGKGGLGGAQCGKPISPRSVIRVWTVSSGSILSSLLRPRLNESSQHRLIEIDIRDGR
jgi:hypothetical protein